MAIAGGINISIHPNKYLLLSQGKFVSSNGKCASFGDGGDGYVPSEGVGAVLLKPLRQAIADGDHIYGVIKGSAIGHSGRTSGYTMPSPSAQANVIKEALERASVDIESISYVEAHGIGTALGDPIEISGLSRAFAAHTDKKQFCAIGSVKSNIGHCESAAGMAGLTKVLLQMKHGMLVPSLNSEPPNPNINFEETPFIVQQKLQEWHRKTMVKAGQKIEYPRRAGLSSFGAGGSNAHFIIEEYRGNNQTMIASNDPILIILSAKDEAKLRLLMESFIEVLEKGYFSDTDLISIAYTLQTGREAMEYRFATEVTSINQLCNRLKEFVSGKTQAGIYLGNTKSNDDLTYKLSNDEDMLQTISAWLEKRKYTQLAEIWVKGFSIDWLKLYTSFPAKISLPTYPFSKERHWFPAPFTVLSSAAV
jgi:acyl transferase domain-containing protein